MRQPKFRDFYQNVRDFSRDDLGFDRNFQYFDRNFKDREKWKDCDVGRNVQHLD